MKRKKTFNQIGLFIILFVLAFCFGTNVDTQAATKAKFSYKKIDRSQNNATKVNVYYKEVVLKGNSKVVKKINKSINNDMKAFLNSDNVKDIYKHSLTKDLYGDEYYYYATSKVTYNKNGVISICVNTNWYSGGVTNTECYGLTYSLKTGNKLKLTDVCKGSASAIRKNLIKSMKKSEESETYNWKKVNVKKISKLNFYLKPNKKAVISFDPYELTYGGWYRTFVITSKYK